MAIRSLSDVNAAYAEGRFHQQRYFKNASTNSGNWTDQSFSSGQPGYDARVGTANVFTPVIATKNDAIWFPDILAGQERYLERVEMRNTRGATMSQYVFDLLGYYPLIDGDSTDLVEMDNTATLPRYQDGKGVFAVFVSYIAPSIQTGLVDLVYTDSADQTRSVRFDIQSPTATGGVVVSGARNTTGSTECAIHIPLPLGSGIKNIQSLQYVTPPGGLHCIYLIKPLCTLASNDSGIAVEKSFLTQKGFAMPRIYDGAAINIFSRQAGGTSAGASMFGMFNFIWG